MPLPSVENSGYIFYVSLAHHNDIVKHLDLVKAPRAKTVRCRFTVNEESVKAGLTFTYLDPDLENSISLKWKNKNKTWFFKFPFSYPRGRDKEVNRACPLSQRATWPHFDVETWEIEIYCTEGSAFSSGTGHPNCVIFELLYMFITFLPIQLIWRKHCIAFRTELHYTWAGGPGH